MLKQFITEVRQISSKKSFELASQHIKITESQSVQNQISKDLFGYLFSDDLKTLLLGSVYSQETTATSFDEE